MELRHLRYFKAVAEEENVSRAALRLHVSQPGISRQIRDLEEEIGFPLFERTPKSLKLTPAGKVFLREARTVLQQAEEAVQKARAVAGGPDELHVGYAPSVTARFLPDTLRTFQEALPAVRVKLHDCSTEEMLAGLHAGKLDVAFTVRPTGRMGRELQFLELVREKLCLAVGPRHRLASRPTVLLEEVSHEPLVIFSRKEYPEAYKLVSSLFASLRRKPAIAEEHDSVSSLIAAVEAGNGVAIVAQSLQCTAGPRLKLIALAPAPEPLVIGAAWLKDKRSPAAQAFVSSARRSASRALELGLAPGPGG